MSLGSIVFFGSSGNARTLRDLMRRTRSLEPLYDVVAYIDDYRGDTDLAIDGVPIISFDRWHRELRDVPCLVTIGDSAIRRTLAERLAHAGASLPAVYDPDEVGDVEIGAGSFVATGLRFGDRAKIGRFAMIYPFVDIPPGTQIGEYVTLCPRVKLRGEVSIGDRTFVGAASKILGDGGAPLRLGSDVRISAGTVVRASIGDGHRAYGDPAREIDGMHVIG